MNVVCFLLGDNPLYEVYIPTFRNTLYNLNWRFVIKKICTNQPPYYEVNVCSDTLVFNPLTPELNPSSQHCLTRFLLGILLLERCISLIFA
jgi:hypothetical protein